MRKVHFWEGFFLQWVNEAGAHDSDPTRNYDQFVLALLAEKEKQIAELEARLQECRRHRSDERQKMKGSSLARMKRLCMRASNEAENGDGNQVTKSNKNKDEMLSSDEELDSEASDAIPTAGSLICSVAKQLASNSAVDEPPTSIQTERGAGENISETAGQESRASSSSLERSDTTTLSSASSSASEDSAPSSRLSSGGSDYKWRVGMASKANGI